MPKNKISRYKTAISFLWQTIKPHKKLYSTASIISLALVGTGLLKARVTQLLIDNAKSSSLQIIIVSLALFLVLIAANMTLSYFSGICVSRLAAKSGYDLKHRISDILLHAEYGELIKLQAGDTLKTVNSDTATVCEFIGGDLIGLFSQFTMAIGALIYVLCANPLLALVTFAYTPIGMFFTLSLNKKMNVLYPIRADSEGLALSVTEQVLSQIPVIKSFIAEKQIREKVANEYEAVYQTDIKISKWSALMQTACSSTSMMPRIIYLIFAGLMSANGYLSVGVLLSVFDLLDFIIGPTVYMPFLLNGLNRSIASMNRISKLTELPQKNQITQNNSSDVPSIKLYNISFSYNEGSPIISNLSFEHTGTGIIVLCGKSGSGKTTLLDLIAGLYEPDSGVIETNGNISVVSQDTYLFDDSIIENVRIAKPSATDDEVKYALSLAGADNFADVKNTPSDLSGGQKQRISLARTILADTDIWLLDEPTSALDAQTEEIILRTIKAVSNKKLILISAHRQSLINIAERKINI
ncbi:ABC transporter ATP-binding protein [Sedimentibacter sp. zth1]|uniref:ABC transporter ATP-binding protein n=1 Tax=Sedimentibacter sp. zth1 TaxID=2816908 RepID=UPI001A90DCE7|nr:ABC transporter ATP-binding protein [Sedimentibacter sp. zth1]QSX04871.1 ABC transporter ATP-binding protein [Sedimentibacter sp. zth1]